MARRSGSRASAGTLFAVFMAIASFAFLVYLPLRRGSDLCRLVGGFGIASGTAAAVWWMLLHAPAPTELVVLAAMAAAAYGTGLVLRVSDSGSSEVDSGAKLKPFQPRRGEDILLECEMRLLGDRRLRGFVGMFMPLGRHMRAGVGLSQPVASFTVVDQGILVVTTKRIVIEGQTRTRTLRGESVLDVSVTGSRLVLRPSNSNVVVMEVEDAEGAATTIRSAMFLVS